MPILAELDRLRKEVLLLRGRIAQLEKENSFLKMHPVFVQGLKGETLIATLTGGKRTAFAAQHDITLRSGSKIEVKFSKLNTPVRGSITRRWNWTKPLGWKDKGKDFDFLILVGEKDSRYLAQYPDDESPFVYFLIPKIVIPSILTKGKAIGSQSQLTTNLARALSPASQAIKKHMVPVTSIESLGLAPVEHALPKKPGTHR